jgi:hypothetical protein
MDENLRPEDLVSKRSGKFDKYQPKIRCFNSKRAAVEIPGKGSEIWPSSQIDTARQK